jgi:hypothetical protein
MSSCASELAEATSQPKKRRRVAYIVTYLVSGGVTLGLIQLVHAPAWVAAVAIFSPFLSAIVQDILQKRLEDMVLSVVARFFTFALAGVATVVASLLIHIRFAGQEDVDARTYITPSNNTNTRLHANGSAVFIVSVPSQRNYLTVRFSVTPSPGYIDNCTNGATLTLVQAYGATRVFLERDAPFDIDHRVPIPVVASFTLKVTFTPQSDFTVCTDDVTIVSAYFHN